MDSVSAIRRVPPHLALAPALPLDAPLDMPVQNLAVAPHVERLKVPGVLFWRRLFVIGGAVALTVIAAWQMYEVLEVGGLTALEGIVLALFVVLFGWIGFSFTNALAGVLAILSRRRDLGIDAALPLPEVTAHTALLMPTYNEQPVRIFSGLEATWESLCATGRQQAFDLFILSDTTDPDIWVAEEAAFLALRERLEPGTRVFYRRRAKNTDRKAGNIADWVTRFGGAYEMMLVLDADSLMTGDCIVRIAAAMEAHPRVGLIQTLPVIVGGRSLFGRMQQFAGRLYGPLIAQGLGWWHGPDSNYWGHNAVIRTRAFAGYAGLPHLKGRKPFGGHILSHDFVEAALIRRGGWAVHMVPWLHGSYEEAPPSLTDLAVRDRRWCQGNLQHAAVVSTRGLRNLSRLHLLTGIGSYITAPLWLLMLIAGLLTSLQARFVPPDYFTSQFSLFPNWPAQDPVRAAWVFVGTMAVLLLPKLMAYVLMLGNAEERRGFGGGFRALLGVLVETLIAGLAAPVMMMAQSAAVVSILAGRDGGWSPQRRGDGSVPFGETVRHFAPHTLFGILLGGAALAISLPLFLWMTPVILGLILAVPLVHGTSRQGIGSWFGRRGILAIPEERSPPPVVERAAAFYDEREGETQEYEAVERLAGDSLLLAAHRDMLASGGERQKGDYSPERLVAAAKIEDAADLASALSALTPREKAAALADRASLERLIALAGDGRKA
ncbi:glucans biosynthesis glucosyltransferase MdoH [Ancylobacter sp. 6x-1]|uniref:Glucans biosynthesis glucosyltransferase H n=1 Tax=Ancylobacter crimeensis TaxID=2579147 RepID=A0ABT0DCJ2_9HYPH|nr:glucans biosynthesis glucosyltransferase MdoH [Ancylobacter crimeensis]MCK0197685.1 glucans biosynthesis glucosyltransferase MdoH [Ancylobacter crimeensis]